MSYIPDCRTDEYCNQKFLNERDKDFIKGYDWAVQQILGLFCDNLDVYPELMELFDDNKAIIKPDKTKIAKDAIEHWAEMERNEIVAGMLYSYDEEEYNKIREKVLNEEKSNG